MIIFKETPFEMDLFSLLFTVSIIIGILAFLIAEAVEKFKSKH